MDVAPDAEVDVVAVAAGVPFGSPQVRESVAQPTAERPEEGRHIGPESQRIVVSSATVGESPEAVEAIRGAVSGGPYPERA